MLRIQVVQTIRNQLEKLFNHLTIHYNMSQFNRKLTQLEKKRERIFPQLIILSNILNSNTVIALDHLTQILQSKIKSNQHLLETMAKNNQTLRKAAIQ